MKNTFTMEIKKIKRIKKYKDIGIYDFSDYAEEITGNALFEINGGAEVENSDKGVAGAKPGAGVYIQV